MRDAARRERQARDPNFIASTVKQIMARPLPTGSQNQAIRRMNRGTFWAQLRLRRGLIGHAHGAGLWLIGRTRRALTKTACALCAWKSRLHWRGSLVRLRADARGRDDGVRQELAPGVKRWWSDTQAAFSRD
jgi:hypothetical protein